MGLFHWDGKRDFLSSTFFQYRNSLHRLAFDRYRNQVHIFLQILCQALSPIRWSFIGPDQIQDSLKFLGLSLEIYDNGL